MNAKASISKELNTKHTKILEGLLKLPENKRCADCKSKGPRWASINLGNFICLQCSGIHRSLGVHISQVRSATLDTWLPEQVAFMQKMGNDKANSYWEAELPPNYDRDEIVAFIHSKYRERKWVPRDVEEEEEEEEEELRSGHNLGNHAAVLKSSSTKKDSHVPKMPSPKGPRSASEKKSLAKVVRGRHNSTGSSSCFRPSTQKTTHPGALNDQMSFSDKSIMSIPPLPSNQQQVYPQHHQDHPEPVCGLTHQRSVSDSYAMNGTITTQSWVNFDYDDPEDTPQVGQWYSSSSRQMENLTLPHRGANSDSFQAFSPSSSESSKSGNGASGDGSGVMRPRDCSSSIATNSRSLSEYDLSSLSQGLTGKEKWANFNVAEFR